MTASYRAVFARGGTSKALIFHRRDLPADRSQWDSIFLRAMGSPDPYGRQLDGMGGGVSSLSKVCIVGPATREDADVDYTFAQVQIREGTVDYGGNCGNMASAIGPFAVDEGLIQASDGDVSVRIHNTNTGKVIRSTFAVRAGLAVTEGSLIIPGVSGAAAPVRLDFLDPGGASTGRLLPTGWVQDALDVEGIGSIHTSIVDAANACVFVDSASLDLSCEELPDVLERRSDLLKRIEAIRCAAAVAMGLASSIGDASRRKLVPLVAMVSAPRVTRTLSGDVISAEEVDLVIRMFSNGLPHRALPLTGALCAAIAAQIEGTIPQTALGIRRRDGPLRLAMPSGVLLVDAVVQRGADGPAWRALHGSFYRTTRRLFEGRVYV